MADVRSRVVVIGAGIIGLCCAYHLFRAGFRVTIVDRALDDDRASNGNAGAIAVAEILPLPEPGIARRVPGFLCDSLGPLSIRLSYLPWLWPYLRHFMAAANTQAFRAGANAMASLLASAIDDHEAMLQSIGLSSMLHRRGGLFIYRSEAGRRSAEGGWALRRELGIHAEPIERAGIEGLEPALGSEARCGYFTEDWAHYGDPRRLCEGLLDYLRKAGVKIIGETAEGFELGDKVSPSLVNTKNGRIAFDHLVIAAGAWSHKLSKQLGDPFPLETERGYNTTLPVPGVDVQRMITFAEDHFVMTPMNMGLRIGGAVEYAGLNAPPNYARSKALIKLARNYLPDLQTEGGTEWMGHRPSTPDSLPVIDRSSHHRKVYYAFGHGHLGLTGSATTGRIIAGLVKGCNSEVDLTPFRVNRFR